MPGTGVSVAVVAPFALVICRGTLFSTPNRQGLVVYFIGVVKGIARVAEPVRFYMLAWLSRSKFSLISDDLNTPDLVSTMHKINMLQQKKAAFQPLERNLSSYIWARYFPGADQSIQTFEVGIWLGWLLLSLSSRAVVCQDNFSSSWFDCWRYTKPISEFSQAAQRCASAVCGAEQIGCTRLSARSP